MGQNKNYTMSKIIPNNEILIGAEYPKKLLKLIDGATKNIYIFMYDWRWYKGDFACDMAQINHALVRAVRRGVPVMAILNSGENVELLKSLGIKAMQFRDNKLMHAKAVIIDEWVSVIGSHNFSQSAMGLNLEVSQLSEDEYTAKRVITYFLSLI